MGTLNSKYVASTLLQKSQPSNPLAGDFKMRVGEVWSLPVFWVADFLLFLEG